MTLTKVTYSMIDGASVNVKDFGAVGNELTDDTISIQTALNSFGATGGVLYFPSGIYKISASLQIPQYVNLQGAGRKVSVIKKYFNGDMVSAVGSYVSIYDMSFDGNGLSYTGKGVVISNANVSNIIFQNIAIENCESQALYFSVSNAGSTFRATNCSFNTLQAVDVMAAVEIGGIDIGATSRHFTDCESGGCTLYNFGGCNDLYVTGGYTNGLIFNVNSSKVMMTNVRIGGAGGTITIKGASHQIENCVFAVPIINESTGLRFRCEVPSYDINDSTGIAATIEMPIKYFGATWAQSSGAQPSLGNGTLEMYFSRQGFTCTVNMKLIMGSTTTYGNASAAYRWTLPLKAASITQYYTGAQIVNASNPTETHTGVAQIGGGEDTFILVFDNESVRDGAPIAWATGDVIYVTFTYFVG